MIVLYILLAILIFAALIFIHELGHFLAAKACGVTVLEFAIGMGPKLVSFSPGKRRARKKKEAEEARAAEIENEFSVDPRPPKPFLEENEEERKEEAPEEIYTTYSIRALPIGGFVSMAGENEESDDPNAFHKKNAAQRMLILAAGASMNLILGFVLMFVLVCTSVFATTEVWYNHEGENADKVYVSETQGLQDRDKILKIGKTRVHTGYDVSYEIMMQGNEPVDILVLRDGERVVVPNVSFPTNEVGGTEIGEMDFGFYAYAKDDYKNVTVGDRIAAAFWRSTSTVKMVWDSLVGLFSGRLGAESVSGPIGVTEVIVDAAKTNWNQLLYIVTVISINLGIMNLMPFPALDGGQLLICGIEAVSRRRIPEKVKGAINLAGLAILMLLMLVVAFKDVVMLVLGRFL